MPKRYDSPLCVAQTRGGMSIGHHLLSYFPGLGHPLLAGGIRRRSNQPTIRAGGSRPPCGNISLCGHLEIVSKYTELTVERHYTRLLRAPRHWERVRCPPVIEAEAVAAMTSPEIGSE